MISFFVFKIRSTCPECGEGIFLEGPKLDVACPSCRSAMRILPGEWRSLLRFRDDAARLRLAEGALHGSSLLAGERTFQVSWGPQRPLCAGCNAVLDLSRVGPGSDVDLPCACGKTTPTYPPPAWLALEDPAISQLFGAPREVHAGAPLVADPNAIKPISFACPDCGANLKVTAESPRVLGCAYCHADLYLPDPLWRALHPIKQRTPFYIACRW